MGAHQGDGVGAEQLPELGKGEAIVKRWASGFFHQLARPWVCAWRVLVAIVVPLAKWFIPRFRWTEWRSGIAFLAQPARRWRPLFLMSAIALAVSIWNGACYYLTTRAPYPHVRLPLPGTRIVSDAPLLAQVQKPPWLSLYGAVTLLRNGTHVGPSFVVPVPVLVPHEDTNWELAAVAALAVLAVGIEAVLWICLIHLFAPRLEHGGLKRRLAVTWPVVWLFLFPAVTLGTSYRVVVPGETVFLVRELLELAIGLVAVLGACASAGLATGLARSICTAFRTVSYHPARVLTIAMAVGTLLSLLTGWSAPAVSWRLFVEPEAPTISFIGTGLSELAYKAVHALVASWGLAAWLLLALSTQQRPEPAASETQPAPQNMA